MMNDLDEPDHEAPAPPAPSDVPPPGFPEVPDFDELIAEYKAKVKPEPEPEADPGDDLDRSLNQYEIEILRSELTHDDARKAIAGDALHKAYDASRAKLDEYAQHLATQQDLMDFRHTLAKIRDTVPGAVGVTDEMLTGYLMLRYQTDWQVAADWENRHSHPGIWHSRVKDLGKELHKQFVQQIDQDATNDHEIVAWAVRNSGRKGASSEPSMPADLGSLSDAQLRDVFVSFGMEPGSGRI
jgi:hypothetical protein